MHATCPPAERVAIGARWVRGQSAHYAAIEGYGFRLHTPPGAQWCGNISMNAAERGWWQRPVLGPTFLTLVPNPNRVGVETRPALSNSVHDHTSKSAYVSIWAQFGRMRRGKMRNAFHHWVFMQE
jgi:hypothetical protein